MRNESRTTAWLIALVIGLVLSFVAVTDGAQEDSTLCGSGIEFEQQVIEIQGVNVLVVYSNDGENKYIIAIDVDKDGMYEVLIFDTNGDGLADMQLEGGKASAEDVIWLYCGYQQLKLSGIELKVNTPY